MTKTLLEMVEEMNRCPVSDRGRVPLASEMDRKFDSDVGALAEKDRLNHRENLGGLPAKGVGPSRRKK
jgi:hypothetical protein